MRGSNGTAAGLVEPEPTSRKQRTMKELAICVRRAICTDDNETGDNQAASRLGLHVKYDNAINASTDAFKHARFNTHAENKKPKRTGYMLSGDLAELELRAERRLTEGSTSVVIMNLPSEERT